jgi:Putative adhesin
MKSRFLPCVVVAFAFLTGSALASTQNVTVSEHGAHSCADVHVSYDGGPAVTAEESLTIPGSVSLNVAPGKNGGAFVTGYDGSQFQVTACKAARSPSELAGIRAQFAGDQLTATGTDQGSSIVFFLIKAPRSASIALKTLNGPVEVSDLQGNVQVRTQNGPIKIRKTSGEVQAYAQNGPIDFTGDSGKIELHATNGPVHLSLAGTHWNGAGVEASTENGPVALSIAPDYNSGVVVQTDGHSPMSCEANLCRNAHDFDENERRIEIGTGDTLIRLSTHNGPVKIATSREVL